MVLGYHAERLVGLRQVLIPLRARAVTGRLSRLRASRLCFWNLCERFGFKSKVTRQGLETKEACP